MDTTERQDITDILERHAADGGGLVPILQDVQERFGFLPESVIDEIAAARRVSPGVVFGVATFYSQFRMSPQGRTTIKVCHGTACHVSGAGEITRCLCEELGIDPGDTTEDGEYTVEAVACLGCCGLAPVVVIGEKMHPGVTAKLARQLIVSNDGGEGAGADVEPSAAAGGRG